jgi:hypothetical protein
MIDLEPAFDLYFCISISVDPTLNDDIVCADVGRQDVSRERLRLRTILREKQGLYYTTCAIDTNNQQVPPDGLHKTWILLRLLLLLIRYRAGCLKTGTSDLAYTDAAFQKASNSASIEGQLVSRLLVAANGENVRVFRLPCAAN